jgi:hypothetical protein
MVGWVLASGEEGQQKKRKRNKVENHSSSSFSEASVEDSRSAKYSDLPAYAQLNVLIRGESGKFIMRQNYG